jgi:VIT1/CCC1 family predicted Fe2+/Mn2+ transporter
MDLPRKIGIAIVMIVPAFVGAGALWAVFHNWIAVILWLLVITGLTGAIIAGKFSKPSAS